MSTLFRRGLLVRVFLHGIILLVISAAGFIGLATVLMGGQARQAERNMADWFARQACDAYAKAPSTTVFATYPVGLTLYSNTGEQLSTSHEKTATSPTAAEFERAEHGETPRLSNGHFLEACPDDSGRYVAVGGPLERPPLGRLSISVVAVVLLIAIGSIPLARSLVKPLRELVATAARFGEGDLAARSRLERADEIGDLARAFNAMAGKLEARLLGEKEMLANISHELRTPLARVRVVLEMAKEEPERAASLLTEVSRDLGELERLTNDVLATMKLDFEGGDGKADGKGAPGLRLRVTDVDLGSVVRHSLSRAVEAHPERDFVFDAPEDLAPLRGDPELLRRLFDNLLDNARKYSSGTVAVRAREETNATVVEVEDNGIGIERGDLERVFEPFFRTDRSRQRETGGTGLGLALCRRIAELHHATITAASGGGTTTVTLRLPRDGAAR